MYIYLDIYEQFSCEMCGKCCRNQWLVTVAEESYRRNLRLFTAAGNSGEFNKAFIRLEKPQSPGEYACIAKQSSGACWFLEDSGLCRLHREAGYEYLDGVCQMFPRYPMNTSRGVELTLSFSCPAVVRMASRTEPLAIIRSARRPTAVEPHDYVAEVYPGQQPVYAPLRYYFELEQHFIDILQCRALSIAERLQLIHRTVAKVESIERDDFLGRKLNAIFYDNYDFLDSKEPELRNQCIADILIENFFVNFVFKKIFYMYGLARTIQLMEGMWQQIEHGRSSGLDQTMDREITRNIIMELEYQYCHNRRELLAAMNK